MKELLELTGFGLERRPYWFPVRHHSPACSRFLRAAIRERQPRLILIEGPWEANHLLEHLADRQTCPPVAIYSCFRGDHERSAAWYPLLEFSPEYVAVKAARACRAQVELIDLPHYRHTFPDDPDSRPAGRDRLLADNGFYRQMARAAGYRSWEEAWDSLFEVRPFADFESFRRELAAFCAGARLTAGDLEENGTLARERFMHQAIEQVLARSGVAAEEALVVTGGFHMFLQPDGRSCPPEPEGIVYTTLVPYSYARVSSLSGYAAGCRAPRFYERLWGAREPSEVPTSYALDVLREARRRGEPVSSADAVATAHTATLLQQLRGRSGVVLDDVNDALITCCCKGDPEQTGRLLQQAMVRVACGEKIGKVSAKVARLPLLADFHEQLELLQLQALTESDQPWELSLDRRQSVDQSRSAFLHRLLLLDVPVGAQVLVSGDIQMFREKWKLRWRPQIESALIERSVYGDTLVAAAWARLEEQVEQAGPHAGQVSRLLVQALRTDLPDMLAHLQRACLRAIDEDGNFLSLAQALANLSVCGGELVERCFERACLALPGVARAGEDEHQAVVEGIRTLVSHGVQDLPRGGGTLTMQLRGLAEATEAQFLRGACLGFLVELRCLEAEALGRELGGARLAEVGELFEGMLAGSRAAVLLGAGQLVAALDELLCRADWEDFLTMLPRLRSAVDRAGQHCARALAREVALRYNLSPAADLRSLPKGLNLLAVRLDEEAARIMAEWE